MPENRVAFVFDGIEIILDDSKLVSLNAIWRAAGSPANKDPRRWQQLPDATKFVDDFARNLNVGKSVIWKTRRGKHLGGTWAHWKVAAAYAQYLSNRLHFAILEHFRQNIEEAANPGLKADRAIDGLRKLGHTDSEIVARVEGKLTRHKLTDRLKEHEVQGIGYATATDAINKQVLGLPAKSIKIAKGLSRSAATRDHLEEHELVALRLAESLASKEIEETDARGNLACTRACEKAGWAVSQALQAMGSTVKKIFRKKA